MTLEAYYNANYLDGLVEDVVKFNTYSTFGGVVYLNTPQKKWLIERYFLELNTVKSSGLVGIQHRSWFYTRFLVINDSQKIFTKLIKFLLSNPINF